ncbi:MAG: hypothetical protein ACE5L7_09725, partial [Candidatus Aminicenantales bacterium]
DELKTALEDLFNTASETEIMELVREEGLEAAWENLSKAAVALKVAYSRSSNGQQSQISINNYTDDIKGMTPEPATTTFTSRK